MCIDVNFNNYLNDTILSNYPKNRQNILPVMTLSSGVVVTIHPQIYIISESLNYGLSINLWSI